MRTTIDLDDKLMQHIRRKAMEEQKSLKEIINQTLAESIRRSSPSSLEKEKPAYTCPTYSMGEPSSSLDKALTLSDHIEDESVLKKLELRK